MSSNLDWSFWGFITQAVGFTVGIITILVLTHKITKTIGKLEERMTKIETSIDGRIKVLEEQINNNPILIAFREIQSVQGKKFVSDLGKVIDDMEGRRRSN